jgi:hypothetical protein
LASESRLWKSRKAKPASQLSHSLDYYDFLTRYGIRILRARSFFHLIQRRGFLSNRREEKKNQDQEKELGQVKAEIHSLEQEMQNAGARTLGSV